MKDYSHLEGKEIIWIQDEGNGDEEIEQGLVAGIDYDLGVTIVNAKNKQEVLTCYPGPMMKGKTDIYMDYLPYWDEMFYCLIEQIESGTYRVTNSKRVSGPHNPFSKGPSLSNCPFNQ